MTKSLGALGKVLAAAAVIVAPTTFAAKAYASNNPLVITQQARAPRRTIGRERHPEIRKAIDALERAKMDLKNADHDFGGHRVEAIASCDRAIAQLRLALQYDRN